MPTSTPGRRAPSPPTQRQRPPSNRPKKPSARRIEQQETEALLDADTISILSCQHEDSAPDGSGTDLRALIHLVADLKETIIQQSNIIENQSNGIENVRAELVEIKAEQRTLKSQNLELQEEVRSLRTQIDSYSASAPSYADVVRTAPNSLPTNVHSISSMGTTPLTMTDTLYCTVDISRVAGEDAEKVSVGAIRANVEKDIRNTSEQANWRCRAVTK